MTARSHVHRARTGQIGLGIAAASTVQGRSVGEKSQEDRRGCSGPHIIRRVIALLEGHASPKQLDGQSGGRVGAVVGVGVGEVDAYLASQFAMICADTMDADIINLE